MCDENIATSINSLSRMSSIIPQSLERIKVTSLAAGIIASVTTDTLYNEEVSLIKGYNTNVVSRVDKLYNVISDRVVLNKSWYESGAKLTADIKNIFTIGRSHPLFTMENVFSFINLTDPDFVTNTALATVKIYGIDLDVRFNNTLEIARTNGIAKAMEFNKDNFIKSAKRIDSDGNRLPLFDEFKLSEILSPLLGVTLGYLEPLPTSSVDFNEYYTKTAYMHAVTVLNEMVEKFQLNTDVVFEAYRDTFETRYELVYEPSVLIPGIVALMNQKDLLPTDIKEAVLRTNKISLVNYIQEVVKAVYVARQEAIERSVLHELNYLPMVGNPVEDILNTLESREEIERKMEALVASSENLIINISDQTATEDFISGIHDIINSVNQQYLDDQISVEMGIAKTAGIALLILGGVIAAYLIYSKMFNSSSDKTKAVSDSHAKTTKAVETATNAIKDLDSSKVNLAQSQKELNDSNGKLQQTMKQHGISGKGSDVGKAVLNANSVEDVRTTLVKFNLLHGHTSVPVELWDLHNYDVAQKLSTYYSWLKMVEEGDGYDDGLSNITGNPNLPVDTIISNCGKIIKGMENTFNSRKLKTPKKLSDPNVTMDNICKYININVYSDSVLKHFKDIEEMSLKISEHFKDNEAEEMLKEAEEAFREAGKSEEDIKKIMKSVKEVLTFMFSGIKQQNVDYLNLLMNIRMWDSAALKHANLTRATITLFNDEVHKEIAFGMDNAGAKIQF